MDGPRVGHGVGLVFLLFGYGRGLLLRGRRGQLFDRLNGEDRWRAALGSLAGRLLRRRGVGGSGAGRPTPLAAYPQIERLVVLTSPLRRNG
jgi:hypothetical protein